MPLELSADLPAPLVPLAWLLGTWEGAGVVGYPSMERDLRFGQEVVFAQDGRPFLEYRSRTWLLDDDGSIVRPLATETGYWRPAAPAPAVPASAVPSAPPADRGGPGAEGTPVEIVLAHPTGIVETYYGHVNGPRVEVVTDVVARTPTAKEYNSAHRMYGLVEGDLLWVMEMAAVGHPLTAHVSARLKRTR